MGVTVSFTGLDDQIKRINRLIKQRVPKVTSAGLQEAGLLIKGRSQRITPHDTGFLVGSAYTVPLKGGQVQEIGYMASYAPFVHEIEKEYTTTPGRAWKFLETAMKQSARDVIKILQKHYKAGLKK